MRWGYIVFSMTDTFKWGSPIVCMPSAGLIVAARTVVRRGRGDAPNLSTSSFFLGPVGSSSST